MREHHAEPGDVERPADLRRPGDRRLHADARGHAPVHRDRLRLPGRQGAVLPEIDQAVVGLRAGEERGDGRAFLRPCTGTRSCATSPADAREGGGGQGEDPARARRRLRQEVGAFETLEALRGELRRQLEVHRAQTISRRWRTSHGRRARRAPRGARRAGRAPGAAHRTDARAAAPAGRRSRRGAVGLPEAGRRPRRPRSGRAAPHLLEAIADKEGVPHGSRRGRRDREAGRRASGRPAGPPAYDGERWRPWARLRSPDRDATVTREAPRSVRREHCDSPGTVAHEERGASE